ncbi:MAG: alkaline phosphatase D family protein [Verrucomicrobiota bacterium]
MAAPQENLAPVGSPHPKRSRYLHQPRKEPFIGIFMVGLGFFYGFIAVVLLLCFLGVLKAEEVTLEIESGQVISRIGFGSCHRQNKPAPILKTIVEAKPQVFIFLGDNVYADTEDMAKMRADYDRLLNQPDFKTLNDAAVLLATWDDHDFGRNDAGLDYAARKGAEQEFYRAWAVPEDAPSRDRDGIYASYSFGPPGKRIQIILLDTRYHRTPHRPNPKELVPAEGNWAVQNDKNATVLGDAQWDWLRDQLKDPAELRIIGSSIQFLSSEHKHERWSLFPRERTRLLELLRQTAAQGVVIISGDRHFAEISRLPVDDPEGIGYPLYDLTSSSLNAPLDPGREPNRYRLANFRYTQANFGWIEVDWDAAPSPTLELEIRGLNGKAVATQRVSLRSLDPAAHANQVSLR